MPPRLAAMNGRPWLRSRGRGGNGRLWILPEDVGQGAFAHDHMPR